VDPDARHDLHLPGGAAFPELRRAAGRVIDRPVADPLLAVEGLTVGYGSVLALREVSLEVASGEIVAVLGPNGAGKTTLLRTLAGALKPRAGSVRFDGSPIAGLRPAAGVRPRLALIPERRPAF